MSDIEINIGVEKQTGMIAGSPRSWVFVTHIPTGTTIKIGLHRSQTKNKNLAIELLKLALEDAGIDTKEIT